MTYSFHLKPGARLDVVGGAVRLEGDIASSFVQGQSPMPPLALPRDKDSWTYEITVKATPPAFKPGYYRYVGEDAAEHEGARWIVSTQGMMMCNWQRVKVTPDA